MYIISIIDKKKRVFIIFSINYKRVSINSEIFFIKNKVIL